MSLKGLANVLEALGFYKTPRPGVLQSPLLRDYKGLREAS